MEDRDCLQRFVFDRFPVRGQIVHLDDAWREVLQRHEYPPAVRELLGQALAAVVLMTSTLKFAGRMTLQLQGNGPLNLLVVQCSDQLTVRGLARWQGEVPDAEFDAQVGEGRMVITIETDRRRQPYQGVVPLQGESLADCLSSYFESSEQLPTRLWLAADQHGCAGLLVQRLPDPSWEDGDEDWQRIQMLSATLAGTSELLDLGHRPLLYRLFHEEEVRLHAPRPVQFECSCSVDRVETMLVALGEQELQSILDEQGSIGVVCEFCNQSHRFDSVDVARMLSGGATPGTPPTVH